MTEIPSTYYQQMDVPVEVPPRTVISLVPSVTESLFDLNLGDRLLAVTDYCVRPAEGVARLPRIGGPKNPDIERIIAFHPDLVIANQEENHRQDVEALRRAGLAVWVTFPRTVADAFNLLWNIMYVFDEPSMVHRVRLIEQTMDWIWRIGQQRLAENPCQVFVPVWLDPLMTCSGDTFASDMLRICGAHNVFFDQLSHNLSGQHSLGGEDRGGEPRKSRPVRYPRIMLADVVSRQPDLILLPSEPFPFTADHAAVFADLDVPAVRNNRIVTMDGSLLTWHGTRMVHAFQVLPGLIYPDGSE